MSDPGQTGDLRSLIEQKRQLEQKILKVAQEVFPIGARVVFEKWRGSIVADIVDQSLQTS